MNTRLKRPVWLFSMDSDQFWAAPTTTGGLQAWFERYGKTVPETEIRLCHFADDSHVDHWKMTWQSEGLPQAKAALAAGLQPVAGFSLYAWNAAIFLPLINWMHETCPELLIIAGGPHVQKAEDYLFDEPIDVVVLGEGEHTFTEFLDCSGRDAWPGIAGLAFLDREGKLHTTAERPRITDLSIIPSALDILPLTDDQGKPLYDSISYETSRGCPFKCSFCEWGTGAIGTKMYQFPLERIRQDWEKVCAAGIKNIWLADSNFGALKEDLEKARIIAGLKEKYGLPSSFATSWSKKHNPRVQEIVLLLNEHGLLPHYQLALQTMTPLALELCNRENMAANKFEPIAKAMAEAGVPIAAELIWALPGDNLADFEKNLDKLIAIFPNVNIFGYVLLPGTEFYEKRFEYRIETLPVAGYGKAKGEYVIGCHTFSREEGMEGYFLITAHMLLIHGNIMPLTFRLLALTGGMPVTPLLRVILHGLLKDFADCWPHLDLADRMVAYENRAPLYVEMMRQRERCFETIRRCTLEWLQQHHATDQLVEQTKITLLLDELICPRYGHAQTFEQELTVDADAILNALNAMEIPSAAAFQPSAKRYSVFHPGGVGIVMQDPDGGSWIKGELNLLTAAHNASLAVEVS